MEIPAPGSSWYPGAYSTHGPEPRAPFCGPLIRGDGASRELWKLDMIKAFDFHLHVPFMGPPCPCSIGPSWNGRIFVTVNNGVSWDHTTLPKPDAPCLVCLNKDTGEVYWKDHSPGANILVTQFASPTVAEVGGRVQVIVPQSDGWVRGFDPMMFGSVAIANGLVIAADAAGLVHCLDARTGKRHWSHDTMGNIIASPLIVGDKVYVGTDGGEMAVFQLGADPKHAEPIATVSHSRGIYGSPVYADGTLYVSSANALFAIDAREASHWYEHIAHWPQWRGSQRDNRSSETGLLASWPADGPPLAWRVDGLGDGIASLALADGRIFTSTTYGNSEYAVALDEGTGEPIWGTG